MKIIIIIITTTKRPQDIIAFEVTTIFETEELQARERDQPMFTPAVRRDIYRILRNPRDPGEGTPQMTNNMFDSVLLAKSVSSTNGGAWDSFAFAGPGANPRGYTILDDEQMLEAISSIGKITPVALAVTQAFEAYLSQLVMTWGEREASYLSVEFLVAFGNEMTRRLDVNNRIRSMQLTPREVDVLKQQPFSNFVDAEALDTYQSGNRRIREDDRTMVPLASDYGGGGSSDMYGGRNNNNSNQNSNSYYPNSNFGRDYDYNNSMQSPPRGDNDILRSNSRMNSYNNNNNYNSQGGMPSYENDRRSNYNDNSRGGMPSYENDRRSNYNDGRSSFDNRSNYNDGRSIFDAENRLNKNYDNNRGVGGPPNNYYNDNNRSNFNSNDIGRSSFGGDRATYPIDTNRQSPPPPPPSNQNYNGGGSYPQPSTGNSARSGRNRNNSGRGDRGNNDKWVSFGN